MIVSPSVIVCMVRHPRGSYVQCKPVAVSGSGDTRKQINSFDAVIPHTRTSASKTFLGRMQLTLQATRPTPHGASCLVQAISAWSVKTRRAPSRHCRDARIYGHTTTALHDMSTPPSNRPHFLSRRTGWYIFSHAPSTFVDLAWN